MQKQIYSNKDLDKLQERQEKGEIKNYDRDIKDHVEPQDNFNLNQFDKKITGASADKFFCVFRVGKKYKNLGQVTAFEKHMERDILVPNADPELSKYNRIIIGNKNVEETVKEYIKDIKKIRSNCNICRDLVLTTSHDFFKDLPPQEREKWVQHNVEWLKDNFEDNCVYACVHMDK